MSDVNISLLRKAVEWVEIQDTLDKSVREWHQSDYVAPRSEVFWNVEPVEGACGSVYCVAGYIGQLLDERYKDSAWGGEGDIDNLVHVSDFAQEALGITSQQAAKLFWAGNTAARVREIAEDIAGEKL